MIEIDDEIDEIDEMIEIDDVDEIEDEVKVVRTLDLSQIDFLDRKS